MPDTLAETIPDALDLILDAAETWQQRHPSGNKLEFVAALGEYLAGVFAAIDSVEAWPTFQRITTAQIDKRRQQRR
jgi:hypothetical protein